MIYDFLQILFFKLTGGRPMIKIDRPGFVDKVSGKKVEYYQDKFGNIWMCDSGPWSLFRVKTE